jgi:hypothetical protein
MDSALVSDLGLITLLVVGSGLSVTVALWAAPVVGFERLALAVSALCGGTLVRYLIAAVFSAAALSIMLGVVPGADLLQGWLGPAASITVILCLLALSVAAVSAPSTPSVAVSGGANPATGTQESARKAA